MDTPDRPARDLLLYLGIGLAVAAIAVAGIYAAHSAKPTKVIFANAALFLVSLGLFGMLVRDYRAYWSTVRCWVTQSLLFVFHLGAGALCYI